MNTGRRGGRIAATVNAQLRRLQLTSAASWREVRSRLRDPPPYIENVLYSRKVRLIIPVTAEGGIEIAAVDIINQLRLAPLTFNRIQVTRIDAWGTPGQGIRAYTFIHNGNPADDVEPSPSKAFIDYGVTGQARPQLHLTISSKDEPFVTVLTGSRVPMIRFNVLDASGDEVAGSIIVDFHCNLQFFQDVNPTKFTSFVAKENPRTYSEQQEWEEYGDNGESEAGPSATI